MVTITATRNCVAYVSAYNIPGGYNLTATVNAIIAYDIPANTPAACGFSIPLSNTQVLKIYSNNTEGNYWKVTGKIYASVYS